jgi:hypothetical protein
VAVDEPGHDGPPSGIHDRSTPQRRGGLASFARPTHATMPSSIRIAASRMRPVASAGSSPAPTTFVVSSPIP